MKFLRLILIIAVTFCISSCGSGTDKSLGTACYKWDVEKPKFYFSTYVDPMIGTGGHGHTFPGPCAPFGMVQLSPDTRVDGSWDGCSGYHYSDSLIYGFSHTHLSGTGCSDYGDILFMPGKYKDEFEPGGKGEGYCSKFSHANEKAEVGYYSVLLDASKTKVELTASPRVGVQRYTFADDGSENWIILDLKHRDEVIDSHLEIVNDHTIRGYRFSKAWANDQRIYFYAEFSEPFSAHNFNIENGADVDSLSGKNVKCIFSYDNKDVKSVVIKVALSPVSCENAQLNMETEVPDFDFDAVHRKVVDQWNDELGKIEVKGEKEKLKIFYTALYHCFVCPNLYCDVNGDYRGMDNKIHRDTLHPQYTVFSLWDTYRALNPLFTIIQQKRTSDFINTFIKQAQEGGMLPVWELSANETNCMISYHSVPVIVDAWMKGIKGFDTATAFEAMKNSAIQGTRGLDSYKKFGYIPAELEGESVSKTLEYAYDDWCISLAAKRMKNDDDVATFSRRAQSWRNLYDAQTGFFRPRLNNSFIQPFDPNEVNFHYTEANAWQYSLAVPQDIKGLIYAHGGDEKFKIFLDSLFTVSSKTSGRDQSDISGMIGQYAQGNEPSHHMAWLYSYCGYPQYTAGYVNYIVNTLYKTGPAGLCGNEDCGQMSAWYVMSAMGIYCVTPGTDEYVLCPPQFGEVNLHLENGNTFTIRPSTTLIKQYIASATLNGKPYENCFIRQQDIMNGGKLNLEISFPKELDKIDWATKEQFRPGQTDYQYSAQIVTTPLISMTQGKVIMSGNVFETNESSARTFSGAAKIELTTEPSVTTIHYSLNNGKDEIYSAPIIIYDHTKLKCWATLKPEANTTGIPSDTGFAEFFKAPDYASITIANKYANQYSAGGDRALIDGIRGSQNFRTGDWQGYEGKDVDAVVDLGATKNISHIAIGFLQDQGAWIFMPDQVSFYYSNDGKNFTELGTNKNTISQNHDGPITHDFYVDANVKARYIKVVAKNIGTCPAWHPGKGKPAWLFADEIIISSN